MNPPDNTKKTMADYKVPEWMKGFGILLGMIGSGAGSGALVSWKSVDAIDRRLLVFEERLNNILETRSFRERVTEIIEEKVKRDSLK